MQRYLHTTAETTRRPSRVSGATIEQLRLLKRLATGWQLQFTERGYELTKADEELRARPAPGRVVVSVLMRHGWIDRVLTQNGCVQFPIEYVITERGRAKVRG